MVRRLAAGYTGTAKTLHWLVVALLIAQFTFAWTMPHIGRNTPISTLISLHFTFGVIILAVALVRLLWRLRHGEPEPDGGMPAWQVTTTRVMHWLLYILLLVVPVLGWIRPATIFRNVLLPQPLGPRMHRNSLCWMDSDRWSSAWFQPS